MKLEKRATNKVGLLIFIIIVIALLAGGGYYLYKNKGKLNIDWDFTMPWQKDDNKLEEKDNASNTTSVEKDENGQVIFNGPSKQIASQIEDLYSCTGEITKTENTNKSFDIYINLKGSRRVNRSYIDTACEITINRILIDKYEISIDPINISVNAGESKTTTISLPKADLESQELSGVNTLDLYISAKNEKDSQELVGEVSFTNDRKVDNDHFGMTIDDLDETKIEYYKTVTDSTNTYIYFIIDNESETDIADIKIRKLLINDKVSKQEDFDIVVSSQAKKIAYVKIPKTEVSNVKKFTVSFFNISTKPGTVQYGNTEKDPDQITYLISNEYTKEF